TPSETPSRTVTRSGVRGKHLFESGLDPERVFVVGCEQAFGPPSWISRVGRATPGSGLLPGAVVRRNCHTRVVRYGGRNRTGRGARSSERARTEPAGARRERERAKRERERARERERERGKEARGMAAAMTTPRFEMEPAVTRTVRRAGPCSVARRGRRSSAATYWRRRAVAVAIGLAALVMAGKAGAALGGSPLAVPERRPATSPYVVQPGDSLWSIAAHFE